MIHPAKLGQFIGSVLVVLNSWNESVRVGIVGTKLHFYCMKVEAVQREMCGKFGLNPLDPVRPDINVPCSMSGSTVVLQNQSLICFFLQRPLRPGNVCRGGPLQVQGACHFPRAAASPDRIATRHRRLGGCCASSCANRAIIRSALLRHFVLQCKPAPSAPWSISFSVVVLRGCLSPSIKVGF